MHPTALKKHRAAQKEAAERFRAKTPEVIGMRGPGDISYPIEDVMPDPKYPSWLVDKFDHPEDVVIFQALNPGLLLALEESSTFYDNHMKKVEIKGFQANFAKSRGFFATDNKEHIALIKKAARYGSEFWDVEDAKKQAQAQNYQAFLADVQDNPMLLKKLIEDNPEKIRTIFKRLQATQKESFVEEKSKEVEEPEKPEESEKSSPAEGDDFEE